MACPNADIYEITDGALRLTKLEDTNHFSINKYFFMNPQRIIHELLDEKDTEDKDE
jgi:predicted ATPase